MTHQCIITRGSGVWCLLPASLLRLLAAVDDDILWLDPLLQHALFGMLPSASEQARRLNLKVANALFVVVQQAKAVLFPDLLVGLFHNLRSK